MTLPTTPLDTPRHNAFPFLSGGGEMGQLIRALDWSTTPLGAISSWPPSLRTTLSILLSSKCPMALYWGPQLVCFYNDAFRPGLGQPGKHASLLGKPGSDFLPEVWGNLHPIIAGVLAGGEVAWSEDQLISVYRNKNLEDVFWSYSFSPIRDEAGQPSGVLVTCQETTRKVETVEQLRLADQHYQNLFREAALGIIVLMGEEMRVDLVNEMYGRIIGRRPEELQNKNLFSILSETEQHVRPMLDQVRISGEPLYLYSQPNFVYVEGEKKESYLNLVYQPYKETDGRITGVMVLCQDVTQQVLGQKRLEESEERFRSLADHIPNLAWMADQDGWIFWYNRRWYEYTGTTSQQMEGWGWQSVHDPLMLPQVMENWTLSIATGKPFEMVFPLKGADGVFKPFLTRVIPVYASTGQVVRWFGTNTDIYEQQLTQQQLQVLNEQLSTTMQELSDANEELAESNQQLRLTNVDLDNFIYSASHDLKAPISNIEGLISVIKKNLSADSLQHELVQKPLALIEMSIVRFKKTIVDLSNITQLQKENKGEVTQVSLAEVVEDVRLDLEDQFNESGGQLEINISACPTILFSKKNLRSIVYNLLSNAIKYRSPDRTPFIQLSCDSAPAHILLTVSDNGLGMDLTKEEKVFAMFGRLHNHVEGSGVGLYMVKKILENAGGRIEVESKVGEGSTFRVYFTHQY